MGFRRRETISGTFQIPRIAMKFFLCISALACLVIIGVAAFMALQQADRVASFSMPTQANVLDKRLEYNTRQHGSQRGETVYRPVVEFRYGVEGQKFTAGTIYPETFEIGGNLGRVAARAPLDRFEKGQQVTAYYIPESPEEACLIRRPSVTPYVFVLLPMILLSSLVVFWPVSRERKADAKRWKARVIAATWHTLGLLAFAHYLFVAGSDYGGGALALFGLYTQLGLIPVIVGLPADKSTGWVSRFDRAATGSLVGTFLGFWLGLGIGFIVLFASGSATATLRCWGYTPAVLAGLLAIGGWIGAKEGDRKTDTPKRRRPTSRKRRRTRPWSSSQPLPPPSGPVPYDVDRRPCPESEEPELLLPAEVGSFHRQWIDVRDAVRDFPIYAQYESPDGEVFVELGIQDDLVDAARGVKTAKAEIESGTPQAARALSLDTDPSYFHAVSSRGAFFAWTRGAYYFSAHARGGQEDLDRFMQAFPY